MTLRTALLLNALFSSFSGMMLLFWPRFVGGFLGLDVPWIWQAIGAGLFLFAADLVWQATRRRVLTWRALLTSALDFLWVLASLLVLLFLPGFFSNAGLWVIAAVALVVMLLAILQLGGIVSAHATKAGKFYHCVPVEVELSADRLWEKVGDLGAIADYAENLAESTVRASEDGPVGSVRTCRSTAGQVWSEECLDYRPGQGYRVRFLTEEPGFPFPAERMHGGWEIEAVGPNRTQVLIFWELELKNRRWAPLMLPLFAFQVDRSMPRSVGKMADSLADRPGNPSGRSPRFKLLTTPC